MNFVSIPIFVKTIMRYHYLNSLEHKEILEDLYLILVEFVYSKMVSMQN